MRMWMVDPKIMCRQHLLGEHVEIHMLVGTLNKGKSIQGYLDRGLVEPHLMWLRHERLVLEMLRRGYRHNSPLPEYDYEAQCPKPEQKCIGLGLYYVDVKESVKELIRRCPECKARYFKPIDDPLK